MSALLSEHPLQPQEAPDSALRLWNPAGSLQSTGGTAGPLAQCPLRVREATSGAGAAPSSDRLGTRSKGGAGLETGGTPHTHRSSPARPAPPGSNALRGDRQPWAPLEAPPPQTPPGTRLPTPGRRSRGPPPAAVPFSPHPHTHPGPARHLSAPPTPLGPLPNRPRRGLARQRAHLRGAPSRPPPARSVAPAQAPTRSLRSPGGRPGPQPAKEQQ